MRCCHILVLLKCQCTTLQSLHNVKTYLVTLTAWKAYKTDLGMFVFVSKKLNLVERIYIIWNNLNISDYDFLVFLCSVLFTNEFNIFALCWS